MDSATGEIGVAVQSHWFSVGSSVDEPIPLFARAFAQDTGWATLLWRRPAVGLLSADSATIARIVRESCRVAGLQSCRGMK